MSGCTDKELVDLSCSQLIETIKDKLPKTISFEWNVNVRVKVDDEFMNNIDRVGKLENAYSIHGGMISTNSCFTPDNVLLL